MGLEAIRIGQGFDIHQFCKGRPLMLGGIEIPHIQGLAGHSDADVLLHALIDALLGALAKGDIGAYFPDTDPQWKNADSKDLLKCVWDEVRSEGWELVNLDASLLLEQPKLRPHIDAIRSSLAELLRVPLEACGLKATTAERMGFIGRGEGVLASCVVLLRRAKAEGEQ